MLGSKPGGATSRAGFVLLVLAVAPFVVVAAPGVVGASEAYVVLSDSMSPAIEAGDVVVVDERPVEEIEAGDVVTFEPPAGGDMGGEGADLVTHRVVEVVERDDGRYFRTKGDANEEPDRTLVPAGNVVGVVAFHIPYVGYVIDVAGGGAGTLAFVVVPATLLVLNEVWTLYRDAKAPDARDDGGDG